MDMAGSVVGLVDLAIKLVQHILQVREELKNAPLKLQDLVSCVDHAGSLLLDLQAAGESGPITRVRSVVIEELGKELAAANVKIQRFTGSTKSGNLDARVLKAFLGQGLVKQNRRTEEITARIKEHLTTLNHALTVETRLAVFTASSSCSPRQRPGIVQLLDRLAVENADDEVCRVALEIGGKFGSKFSSRTPESNDLKRAAREGGYEIENSTKIRFEISVDEDDYFFYVVTFDCTKALVELFYPNHSLANHSLNSKFKRFFPDQVKSRRDPISIRIESSDPSFTQVEQQIVYIVFAGAKLHEDEPHRALEMKDIQDNINISSKIIVRKYIFDIMPV
ncbi:uncharacterized protein LOC9647994 [Selaginella moellendorffii]|uniref:uncharacterized protein LOC9647994 n=1 Tax=Selaginella moellendorffii TaxID=88036 RepID=UPI000D1C2F05|nr:uncharacterized protein LOC9647994 [Selaginella moellendorffii]|eukprot:XP_024519672.1 uncharacterized protein LOC9647994 [Selaginella moellendorffii]